MHWSGLRLKGYVFAVKESGKLVYEYVNLIHENQLDLMIQNPIMRWSKNDILFNNPIKQYHQQDIGPYVLCDSLRHQKMNKPFERKDFERQALSHLDSFYFIALKLTGRREDAEDVVQETYYKAFNNRNQLKDLEKCKVWLYRIMINVWKNWMTKRSKIVFPVDIEQWEESTSQYEDGNSQSYQMNPEEDLMQKELWRDVESAISQLPSNYRMALLLADIEGFSYKEISEMMEWPVGTVMSRLSRARSFLGRLLIRYKEKT